MNISKMASTVILTTAIATIFLFAIIFYLYGGENARLKEAFSTTASFFGGIATLVAAYIATQLFNDWREEHDKQIENKFVLDVINAFEFFDNEATLISLTHIKYRSEIDLSIINGSKGLNCEHLLLDSTERVKNILIPLSRLESHYKRYVLIHNKTQDKAFLKSIKEMKDFISKVFHLDESSNIQNCYLENLLPFLKKEIEFLEDNYIDGFRSSLKSNNKT